jgi:hypothetical protein
MKDFYLTLPSNSSMNVFPENTAAKYVTKLHHTLEFSGKWVVGLVEIIFPMSFYNIRPGYNTLQIFKKAPLEGRALQNELHDDEEYDYLIVPPGNYPSIQYLTEFINNAKVHHGSIQLKYNELTSHLSAQNNGKRPLDYTMFANPGMAEILGFDHNLPMSGTAKNPTNLYKDVPQQLFVYSDILEPQLLGDTVAPLLRIVGIEQRSDYGKVIVKTYETPHYTPLLKRQFETVEIDIRDSTGAIAPFQYGPVIVKLHFKNEE